MRNFRNIGRVVLFALLAPVCAPVRAKGAIAALIATLALVDSVADAHGDELTWHLMSFEHALDSSIGDSTRTDLHFSDQGRCIDHVAYAVDVDDREHPTVGTTLAGEPVPDSGERMPPPEGEDSYLVISRELEMLHERLAELEAARVAHEDATRTLIRQSFAEQGPNINDYVVFGGTLESLVFWADDFAGVDSSDILLDTVELDFEIQLNDWVLGGLIIEYDDGTNVLFPTSDGDEFAVDRLNVDIAFVTVGNTQYYPLFMTVGRIFVPFGISTGDPVADALTIIDPLTIEVFETREDVVLFGFEWPVQPPPPPLSPNPVPPPPEVRPILINPLVRGLSHRLCTYCGYPPKPPAPPAYVPPPCLPPLTGAIYFYNGETIEGTEDHIEHMGGTLGYRARGVLPRLCLPWSIDLDVDVNSSVFDSNFLEFEYRRFLNQIGYVPGMAAHAKSTLGPTSLVLEWNGAIDEAEFLDDLGTPISIRPEAWQIQLAYQFDWNPYVEVIGAQGTYFVIGYSESSDLAGVTRLVGDPMMPTPIRVGFVPEKRLSVGVGEWVTDGLRIAVEYSHAIDYDVAEGGTGNSADGVFAQLTYEW